MRLVFACLLVLVTAAPCAAQPELSLELAVIPPPPSGSTAPPDVAPPAPRTTQSIAPAIHGAIVGQALGFAFGVLAGALAWSVLPCADPAFEPGACEHQGLFVAGVGAMLAAPFGAATGAIAGGELAGQRGDLGGTFLGAISAWLFTLLTVPIWASTDELLTIPIGASLLCGAIGPVLAGLSFDGRRTEPIVPVIAARPDLASAGVAGAF